MRRKNRGDISGNTNSTSATVKAKQRRKGRIARLEELENREMLHAGIVGSIVDFTPDTDAQTSATFTAFSDGVTLEIDGDWYTGEITDGDFSADLTTLKDSLIGTGTAWGDWALTCTVDGDAFTDFGFAAGELTIDAADLIAGEYAFTLRLDSAKTLGGTYEGSFSTGDPDVVVTVSNVVGGTQEEDWEVTCSDGTAFSDFTVAIDDNDLVLTIAAGDATDGKTYTYTVVLKAGTTVDLDALVIAEDDGSVDVPFAPGVTKSGTTATVKMDLTAIEGVDKGDWAGWWLTYGEEKKEIKAATTGVTIDDDGNVTVVISDLEPGVYTFKLAYQAEDATVAVTTVSDPDDTATFGFILPEYIEQADLVGATITVDGEVIALTFGGEGNSELVDGILTVTLDNTVSSFTDATEVATLSLVTVPLSLDGNPVTISGATGERPSPSNPATVEQVQSAFSYVTGTMTARDIARSTEFKRGTGGTEGTVSGVKRDRDAVTQSSIGFTWSPNSRLQGKLDGTTSISILVQAGSGKNAWNVAAFNVSLAALAAGEGTLVLESNNVKMTVTGSLATGFKVSIQGLASGTKYTLRMQTVDGDGKYSKGKSVSAKTQKYNAPRRDGSITRTTGGVSFKIQDGRGSATPAGANYEVGIYDTAKKVLVDGTWVDNEFYKKYVFKSDSEASAARFADLAVDLKLNGAAMTTESSFTGADVAITGMLSQRYTFGIRAESAQVVTAGTDAVNEGDFLLSSVGKFTVRPETYKKVSQLKMVLDGTDYTVSWKQSSSDATGYAFLYYDPAGKSWLVADTALIGTTKYTNVIVENGVATWSVTKTDIDALKGLLGNASKIKFAVIETITNVGGSAMATKTVRV